MHTNLNRLQRTLPIATARGRLLVSTLALCAVMCLPILYGSMFTPAAMADRGGPTDGDLQLQVRNLLNPAIAGSWGNTLNTGAYNAAHWNAMNNLYDAEASLLPTLKSKIWKKNVAGFPNIIDYFRCYFLAGVVRPKLQAIPLADQHVVIMGDYAANQGLYKFRMENAAGALLQLVEARYTFVYKKVNRNLGWDVAGNVKIIQHHSSLVPSCPGDIASQAGGTLPDKVVNASDLLAVLNAWGPCPNPPAGCP